MKIEDVVKEPYLSLEACQSSYRLGKGNLLHSPISQPSKENYFK